MSCRYVTGYSAGAHHTHSFRSKQTHNQIALKLPSAVSHTTCLQNKKSPWKTFSCLHRIKSKINNTHMLHPPASPLLPPPTATRDTIATRHWSSGHWFYVERVCRSALVMENGNAYGLWNVLFGKFLFIDDLTRSYR